MLIGAAAARLSTGAPLVPRGALALGSALLLVEGEAAGFFHFPGPQMHEAPVGASWVLLA